MRTGMLSLSTLLLAATSATPAFGNDVHIVDASGAGEFPTIQQALNSAADGDVILVRPGVYPSFVVDDLGVTIIADGGGATTGTIRARDLAADKVLVIDGLNAQGAPSLSPSSARGAFFINCAGSIRVQHSSFQGADSISTEPEDGWDGAYIEHCLDVSFTDCVLEGGLDSGEYAANPSLNSYSGGNGLYATDSVVSVFASEARGRDGRFAVYWDGGEGGDGAHLESGSRLIAHSSTFEGGDGGGTNFDMGYGQDGGHGVYTRTGSSADVVGCTLIGGQGGSAQSCAWCGAGEDGYPELGDTTVHPGDVRDLCLVPRVGPLREGSSAVLSIGGYAGSRASLIYSLGADRRELGAPDKLLMLASPFLRLIPSPAPRPVPLALPARNFLGAFNSAGTLSVTFQADGLLPGVEGERVLTQPLHVPSSGAWNLGAPHILVILDAAI